MTGPIRSGSSRVTCILLCSLLAPLPAAAQGAVDPQHGVVAVAQALRGLGSVKRVLLIGAHPDDEDTGLLALLVRGMGTDAAYLSLTRGEGGQNLIGPELGVGLGLLRTEELLAARRLDGAFQFFSRAYDFGYSKSAEETFRFWPRDSLLSDVVYVVRRFRPQVIVSIFSGTRRDGHGQHQAAGIIAREAFDAAGDPGRFSEQLTAGLEPWTPLKLYRSTRFDTVATTLTVETGTYDAVLGRSYHQIAMASRSRHRSQDMGRIESLGPRRTRLALLKSCVSEGAAGRERSIFDGVDTTLVGVLDRVTGSPWRGALADSLRSYGEQIETARRTLSGLRPSVAVVRLALALATLRHAIRMSGEEGPGSGALRFFLRREEARLDRAVAEAAGVVVDAFSDDDLVVPGQGLTVEVQVWNGGDRVVGLRDVSLRTPSGWRVEPLGGPGADLAAGALSRHQFRVIVPEDAEPTRPYFLRAPRQGALYAWPADTSVRALPFDRALLEARVELTIAGEPVSRRAKVVYRFADQALGEVRRPVYVVPAVAVGLEPSVSVWPLRRGGELTFSVGFSSESLKRLGGRVRLELPSEWSARPASAEFVLGPGRTTSVEFAVTAAPELSAGVYGLTAVAETTDGRRYRTGYSVIDYPHIRRRTLLREATARIEAFDLAVPADVRVGYVPGAGDAVADAIEAMGVAVDVLDSKAITAGDLTGYDVIVLGIRAYEANPAVVAANDRLLDWVRRGGILIVQYQQYGYFNGNYAPYPLRARFPHDRVTDEEAPLKLLLPEHPVFNRPNRIGPKDFEGWVQERGLYFAHEWDEHYQPLLETADPGESPKRGALLVARYGAGLYVYTGLALFRQLPAGVPGAYRLLANLLALGR